MEIQTPNETYAQKLDEIIADSIENCEELTLDDLEKARAKIIGRKSYPLSKIVSRSYLLPKVLRWYFMIRERESGWLHKYPPFLGVTKLKFPDGISYSIDIDPKYGDGYRSVIWEFNRSGEEYLSLDLSHPLTYSSEYHCCILGRRGAEQGPYLIKI